jgi:hypothetical protein
MFGKERSQNDPRHDGKGVRNSNGALGTGASAAVAPRFRLKKYYSTNKGKYARNHPKQIQFEKNLLDYISSGAPLNTTENFLFLKLIRDLDLKIWIPSRRTVTRKLLTGFQTKVRDKVLL